MADSSLSFLHLLLFVLLHGFRLCSSTSVFTGYVTVSNFVNVGTGGIFLYSPASTFHSSMCNPGGQRSRFYLCIVHNGSDTVIWYANVSSPVTSSGTLTLSPSGLTMKHNSTSESVVWSTPPLRQAVSALRLLDSGNLELVDKSNGSLWQSFDYPTDTFMSGQRIPVGAFLTSSVSDSDFMTGDYKMVVTDGDILLRWRGGQQYWALLSDIRSVKNTNGGVSYMVMNSTGLFLMGWNSDVAVVVSLPSAGLRIGKIETYGRLTITSYATASSTAAKVVDRFIAPARTCDLPFSCKTLGLCTVGSNDTYVCSCPTKFQPKITSANGCLPSDGSSLASPSSCSSDSQSLTEYVSLPAVTGYIGMKFSPPTISGSDITNCRSICSESCSCLGFYYVNSSKSCYFIENELGSFFSGGDMDEIGYIKTIISGVSPPKNSTRWHFYLPIVLPSVALFLLVVVLCLFFCGRRRKWWSLWKPKSSLDEVRLGQKSNPRIEVDLTGDDDDGDDDISIPGLPTRFTYQELEAATEGFKFQIGSGGFGEVYKGTLPDNSTVAVKMISNLSVQVKKELFTEIAVIGKVHHINLVKLRGFCAEGSHRLLVYEYMNRGSLDKSLFATERSPVLMWQERVDIAVGAARGLSYLHGSCDNRIIHCDVKPENILLDDQNGVKISDFGLAKLLSPEQSSLFTTMRGTRGYLAPEWLTNSSISDRIDVYSFGMVLLEIIRGRKNSIPSNQVTAIRGQEGSPSTSGSPTTSTVEAEEETYFPLVALEKHEEGRYQELGDPRLNGRVTETEVSKMVKTALCCLHEDPRRRPAMAVVAGMLDGSLPVWDPQMEALNFLRVHGREMVDPAVEVKADGGDKVGYVRERRLSAPAQFPVITAADSKNNKKMAVCRQQKERYISKTPPDQRLTAGHVVRGSFWNVDS